MLRVELLGRPVQAQRNRHRSREMFFLLIAGCAALHPAYAWLLSAGEIVMSPGFSQHSLLSTQHLQNMGSVPNGEALRLCLKYFAPYS